MTTKWPSKVSEELRPYYFKRTELSCYQETILWGKRVVIPQILRKKALEVLHECHPGIVKMKQMAREYIYRPGIDRQIEEKANSCSKCLMNSNDPPKLAPHPWIMTEKPWQRIHADFAQNFLGTNFLIIIDSLSKWMDVYEQPRLTTEATVQNFLKFSRRTEFRSTCILIMDPPSLLPNSISSCLI